VKVIRLSAILLAIFMLVGCGKEAEEEGKPVEQGVVKEGHLIERGGAAYQPGSGDMFTGTAVAYHDNDQKRKEVEYRDGKRHGKITLWHKNGQKSSEGAYRAGREQSNSTVGRRCSYNAGRIPKPPPEHDRCRSSSSRRG